MNFNRLNYALDDLDFADWNKPATSVYIEFVRKNGNAILELGMFEALRRWLLSKPHCCLLPITPEKSHRLTREFIQRMNEEQKKED